jgi:hypothetical protein
LVSSVLLILTFYSIIDSILRLRFLATLNAAPCFNTVPARYRAYGADCDTCTAQTPVHGVVPVT